MSLRNLAPLLLLCLAGCTLPPRHTDAEISARITALLPADAVLLGEKHDIPAHQQLQRSATAALAARGQLAGLALEMAERGHSTAGLARDASEAQVQQALRWSDQAWPWKLYGPAVMEAVRAGVPVVGANLPRAEMRQAMGDAALDALLPGPLLAAQQAAIQAGHCDQLPPQQIAPMARIQIARDQAMARAVVAAAVPGKTVLLLAGGGHVDRRLGVPNYLPPGFTARAVELKPEATAAPTGARFDASWPTPAGPETDYCAELARSLKRPAAP